MSRAQCEAGSDTQLEDEDGRACAHEEYPAALKEESQRQPCCSVFHTRKYHKTGHQLTHSPEKECSAPDEGTQGEIAQDQGCRVQLGSEHALEVDERRAEPRYDGRELQSQLLQ